MPPQDQPGIVAAGTFSGGNSSTTKARPFVLLVLLLLPFCYLWFRLIDNLHFEWDTNPQYGYGWLVPLLCIGLAISRWYDFKNGKNPSGGSSSKLVFLVFMFIAFLYLPTRLVEAATPEWRPIQWLLGCEAVGLTICAVKIGKGRGWMRQLAFPIAFFFVAIPWPTLIEAPIIQTLTHISAGIVTELMGWVGVPAIAHGNIIEISTGVVGINEACSGIRSFQSSLMISLFLGEFYRLRLSRRLLLIPLGLFFSLAFNICRMSFLTMVASKRGIAAISHFHDPAGITITLLCTLFLWGLAAWMSKWKNSTAQTLVIGDQERLKPGSVLPRPLSGFQSLFRISIGLTVWLCLVEAGVQIWYKVRESHLVIGPAWTLNFPKDNPTLKNFPIDEDTQYLLRYDEGREATWAEPDGSRWQGFYFNWFPGRVAGYLAKRHTPEICLIATGLKMISGPELAMLSVHGINLPIRSYTFESEGRILYVFHCRWEAGADTSAYVAQESARYNLIRAIWTGRGNKGQRVLEFVVDNADDIQQAKRLLAQQLEKMIAIEKPTVLSQKAK